MPKRQIRFARTNAAFIAHACLTGATALDDRPNGKLYRTTYTHLRDGTVRRIDVEIK